MTGSGSMRRAPRPLAAAACAVLMIAGIATPELAAPKAIAHPKLYILDCGTIAPMDPKLFGLEASEIKGDGHFVTPCYLVVHPKGTLIWDVGQVPDARIPDDGTEVVEQGILKATRRLAPQLKALGYEPKD